MENGVTASPRQGLDEYKRLFEDARDLNEAARQESFVDSDYFHGYQWTAEERKTLEGRQQPALYFNETRVSIRGLVGVWEQGETDPRAWPREPGDEGSALVATQVLRYSKDVVDWSEKRTYCALNYFVEGTCAVFVGAERDGRPTADHIPFHEFFFDPRSQRLDFMDARYMGIGKWRFADDVAREHPEQADSIMSSVDSAGSVSTGGDSFEDRPAGQVSSAAWFDRRLKRVFQVEMYHREGGVWQRCIFWGGGVINAGPSPWLDTDGQPTNPIKARSCYIDRDNRRYGEVRDLRSPQDAINARESKLLHLANSRQVQATDSDIALNADPDQVRREAARPDGVLPPGWGVVPTTDMSSGQAMLLQSARAFINRIGQNPGVLASQSASASGRSMIARQQAGMTDSAMTLGGLARFEKQVFTAFWERAQQFMRAPAYIRITGKDNAAEFVGINQPIMGQGIVMGPDGRAMVGPVVLGYDNQIAEMHVDIEIDAVTDTASLAVEQFEVLAGLAQSGVAIPPKALIMASALPDKSEILEAMEQPDPQQAAMAQAAMQLDMAGKQAELEETQSKTAKNYASAQESEVNAMVDAMQAGFATAGAGQMGAASL